MSMDLEKDIETAKGLIEGTVFPPRHVHCDISGIYRTTNEIVSAKEYQDAIRNRERILSVLASGDQIINSILLGSKDIEGFDISTFPKYYLMLKLAALKALKLNEFMDFFYDKGDKLFDKDMYGKIQSFLDEDNRKFWDSIISQYDAKRIVKSPLFRQDIVDEDLIRRFNPYMHDGKYEIVKEKIGDITVKFHTGNILNLDTTGMKGFDLVNLSNIINYVRANDNDYSALRAFIENVPLNEDGLVLNYNVEYYELWQNKNYFSLLSDNYRPCHLTDERKEKRDDPDWMVLYKRKW